MRLLHLFSIGAWRSLEIKTEVKVALIALLGTIVAAAIPVVIDLIPQSADLNLISLHAGRYSYGLSNLAVLDLKLDNSGGKPAKITEAKITAEKIFRFDAPVSTLFRVPATGIYDTSLANLAEGDDVGVGLFHEISAQSSERITIVLGGNGLFKNADGSLERGEPSYLARITVTLLSGKNVLVTSSPIDVLVLNMDQGSSQTHASSELKDDIEHRALPTITASDICNTLKGLGLSVPEWFDTHSK
jgi:hypothetical protein